MAKQPAKGNHEDRFQIASIFRWEFLRRDPSYRKDYIKRDRLPNDYWHKNYGLPIPINPDRSKIKKSDKSVGRYLHEGALYPVPGFFITNYSSNDFDHEQFKDNLIWQEINWPPEGEISSIDFRVDLTRPEAQIKADFARLIREVRKYKKTHSEYRRYPEYLRIYDLRQKGLTFSVIVKRLYEVDEKSIEWPSRLEKVKRSYRECKSIIQNKLYRRFF